MCPVTKEWIKNMCFMFTIGYFSAIKINEVLFLGKLVQLGIVIK